MNYVYYGVAVSLLKNLGGWPTLSQFDQSCNFIMSTCLFLMWMTILSVWTVSFCCCKKKRVSPPRLIAHRKFKPPQLTRRPQGLLEESQFTSSSQQPSSGFVQISSPIIRHHNSRTVDPVYTGHYLTPRPLTPRTERPAVSKKPSHLVKKSSQFSPTLEHEYEDVELS